MQVTIKNARLAFASLFEAREQLNGGLKFEANFLFPKDSEAAKAVKDAMRAVAKELWKDNADNVLKGMEKNRKCLRDGDQNVKSDGSTYDGYPGNLYVVAKSKTRPTVVDGKRNPLVAADGKPYNGCYVNAIIDVYATNKKEAGGNGIFAELKGVQFLRDGDAFGGGGAVSASAFDEVDEEGASAGADSDDFV